MTVLQRKIDALTSSQKAEVVRFIDGILEQKSNEDNMKLTDSQKAMLEMSERDIEAGRLIPNEEAERMMDQWLGKK